MDLFVDFIKFAMCMACACVFVMTIAVIYTVYKI